MPGCDCCPVAWAGALCGGTGARGAGDQAGGANKVGAKGGEKDAGAPGDAAGACVGGVMGGGGG